MPVNLKAKILTHGRRLHVQTFRGWRVTGCLRHTLQRRFKQQRRLTMYAQTRLGKIMFARHSRSIHCAHELPDRSPELSLQQLKLKPPTPSPAFANPSNTNMSQPPANHETSRLLSLPRELRDPIWELAVANRDMHINENGSIKQHESLLVVCRQTRHEVTSIFYTTAIFHCPTPTACLNWLAKVPSEYHELIKDVRVSLDGPEDVKKDRRGRMRLVRKSDSERLSILGDLKTDMWLEDVDLAEGVIRDATRTWLRV